MPEITLEYLPLLADLGIQRPGDSRWTRLEPLCSKNLWSHHFCSCGNGSLQHRVKLIHAWLGNRRIFIGQCGRCMAVYWRDARGSPK